MYYIGSEATNNGERAMYEGYYLERPSLEAPERVFVNQPSGLQPYHKYHGQVGIAVKEPGESDYAQLFFTDGPTPSIRIQIRALSRKV